MVARHYHPVPAGRFFLFVVPAGLGVMVRVFRTSAGV
jgi:hypothetical protein